MTGTDPTRESIDAFVCARMPSERAPDIPVDRPRKIPKTRSRLGAGGGHPRQANSGRLGTRR